MPRRNYVLSAILSTFAVACTTGPEHLSNALAERTIDSFWTGPDVGLVLGQVRFVDPNSSGQTPQASRGEDALAELPLYRAFANRGLITIGDERDLTSGFTGWGDFIQLTQSGVRRTAKITATDKGKASGEVRQVGAFQELWFRISQVRVSSIVSNDSVQLGADRYHVVMGNFTVDVPDDIKPAWTQAREAGSYMGHDRKFKVLLKYDPFKKVWNAVAMDVGAGSEGFRSARVDGCIASIRMAGTC